MQDITLRNSFNALPEETVTDPTEKPTTRIAKSLLIYIGAKIADPLIEFLNNTAKKDNYIIKQVKIDQVKVQTNTPDTFRKVTKSLKEKNVGYHQLSAQSRQKLQSSNQGITLKNKHRQHKRKTSKNRTPGKVNKQYKQL